MMSIYVLVQQTPVNIFHYLSVHLLTTKKFSSKESRGSAKDVILSTKNRISMHYSLEVKTVNWLYQNPRKSFTGAKKKNSTLPFFISEIAANCNNQNVTDVREDIITNCANLWVVYNSFASFQTSSREQSFKLLLDSICLWQINKVLQSKKKLLCSGIS